MNAPRGGPRALVTPRAEWDAPEPRQVSTVDCTLLAAVPRADRTISISLALALGPLPNRWTYVVAFLRGRSSSGVVALDLVGQDGVPASVSGIGESAFGWHLGDFDRGTLPHGTLVVHAVLALTETASESELTVRVDVSFKRPRFPFMRLDHARVVEPWTFPLTFPARSPVPGAAAVSPVLPTPPNAEVRLCVAADIEGYGRFLNPEALRAQERFVEMMRMAREHARVDESEVLTESAGDSQYAVLPNGIDETAVVPRLVEGLVLAARAINRDLSDHARLRVRVAIDRGLVTPSVNGWVGRSTIAVHRLLDSPPLRAALAAERHHDHALIVSDTVYQDVVRHGYGGIDSDEFVETVVELPHKNFTERAWLRSPSR